MSNCNHLGMYVTIASMHIRRNLDAIFSQHGLSSGIQGRILGELVRAQADGNAIYQKDVEKIFGIRRSSVNSLISGLESHGYVERIPDSSDARLKQLQLTETGQLKYAQICKSMDDFEDSLASEFTPEEKQLVVSMMQRIIHHYAEGCTLGCDRKELEND